MHRSATLLDVLGVRKVRAGSRRAEWAALVATTLVGLVVVPSGPPATAAPGGSAGEKPAAAQSCDVYKGSTWDDPLQQKPWPLDRLRPERAWALSRGRGVKVAVIDSGVSTDPAVLKGAVYDGRDYLASGGNGTCDQFGHGTLVASIIAGRQTDNAPYYGVAPEAQILPYRVLRDLKRNRSTATPGIIADAIRRAVDAGAQVINLSLITAGTDAVTSAVRYAEDHDVVLVAAAGNEGGTEAEGSVEYPAALPGVLAVGGIDEKGVHVGSSNTANYLEIAAPGDKIEGPAPKGGGYFEFPDGGTSFAAPYVSGTAALLRAYDPNLTASQVRERIIATADHPPEGWNQTVGYGVVDPYRALSAILKNNDHPASGAGQEHRALPDAHTTVDPMRRTEITAGVLAAALLVLALLVMIATRVVPRGRRLGWRACRAEPPAGPTAEAKRHQPAEAGTKGEGPVSITAPSSRSAPPAGPGGARSAPTVRSAPRAIPGAGRR